MRVNEFKVVQKVESFPTVPDMDPETLYLAEIPGIVNFLCPCGCGQVCPTRIRPIGAYGPRWSMETDAEGRVTISPSIHWMGGCKSHFSIKKNQVVWHPN